MTGLPEKLRSGDSFKNGVFEKINALIEYCRTHELRGDNRTVRINRNASGITISAIARNHPGTAAGIASGAGRYTGYFKLALIETDETGEDGESVRKYSVAIVDGATYDPDQTPLSGNSVCKVNNVTFSLEPYQSGEITETSVFALRYTAPVEADEDSGTEAQTGKVEIVNLTEEGYSYLPSDTSKICYYQLGRAIVTTDTEGTIRVTIQQDHNSTASNGIPQIFRYALCGE